MLPHVATMPHLLSATTLQNLNTLLYGIPAKAVFVRPCNQFVELVILISLIPTTKYALAALSTETDSSPKILAIFALEHADMQGGILLAAQHA